MTDGTHDVDTTETAEYSGIDPDPPDTEAENAVVGEADRPAPTKRPRLSRRRMQRNLKVVPVILVLLLLISGGAATWRYFEQYRSDQQTDPSVAHTVVRAASDGTVALLSYSPDSLDKDFAVAKSHLSGDFRSYYNQFTEQIVAPAAKQKSVKTTAHVIGAAISELHLNSAVVLVFVDQSTTSEDNPDPSMAGSSVLVSMTRVNGNWLITKFDPV